MVKITRAHRERRLAGILAWLSLAIIGLLPLHALFTTWAGSNFGHIDLFRVWKELILLLISFGCLYLLIKSKKLRTELFSSKLFLVFVFYLAITVLRSIAGLSSKSVNIEALSFGLISNLRYIVFFFCTFLIAKNSKLLRRYWKHALLLPSVIVVFFGLLQKIFLPNDFLRHFGYGRNTIPVSYTIDNKEQYLRIQSTLRGPNPLGAYLVLILSCLVVLAKKGKKLLKNTFSIFIVLALFCLFFTYSRSAWIGLAFSIIGSLLIYTTTKKFKKAIPFVIISVLIIFTGIVYSGKENDFIQNVFFHSDESSVSLKSSNENRYKSQIEGLKDVYRHPLGQGPGSAGPASARNDGKVKISENYYLQIAQETGVFGLILLSYFYILIVLELFSRKNQTLPAVLLISFVGISIINLFSHAWMDDTLSLIWWGLAGIALSQPVILKTKAK